MKARILLALTLCVTCLVMMVGCAMNPAANANDPQTQNRQYMSSVNSIMGTMNENLGAFETAVKEGDVVSLDTQAKAVDKAVSDLKALTVPENMQEIHDQYVKGAEELQTAFNSYLDLYQSVKQGGDTAGYADALAEIQTHYDAGIAALQEADNKASEA